MQSEQNFFYVYRVYPEMSSPCTGSGIPSVYVRRQSCSFLNVWSSDLQQKNCADLFQSRTELQKFCKKIWKVGGSSKHCLANTDESTFSPTFLSHLLSHLSLSPLSQSCLTPLSHGCLLSNTRMLVILQLKNLQSDKQIFLQTLSFLISLFFC